MVAQADPWVKDPQLVNITIGVLAAMGLVQCLFGYRLFRWMLGLTGFAAGGLAGGAAGMATYGTLGAVIGGIVGGAMGAALMVAFYFIGVFAMGVVVGGLIGIVLAGGNAGTGVIAAAALGLIGGVVAVMVQKLVIVLSTSLVGAYLVILAALHFAFGGLDIDRVANDTTYFNELVRERPAILACWAGLALLGVIVQYVASPGTDDRKEVAASADQIRSS